MEPLAAYFSSAVLKYDLLCLEQNYVNSLMDDLCISNTGEECDIILEPCIPGKKVCMYCPLASPGEFFYFYEDLLETLRVGIPFTGFEADLLTALNTAPSQLQPNSWGIVRAFEIVCGALGITPTVDIFISFYEKKEVGNGSWVSLSRTPGRGLL